MLHKHAASTIRQKPWLIALAISLLIALWLLSGQGTSKNSEHEEAAHAPNPEALVEVQVLSSRAETIAVEKEIRGRSTPWSEVSIAAETEGRVIEVFKEAGERVNAGDAILKIDLRARDKLLNQAKAMRAQRKAEYTAAKSLHKKGLLTDTQLAQNLSALESARADEAHAELDLANTVIRSPINGVLEQRLVDVGDYLKVGAVAAHVADIDQLKVIAYVSEHDIRDLRPGQSVRLSDHSGDKNYNGIVHFTARTSDANTRTYRVEVKIDNSELRPAGESLRGRIEVATEKAHNLSIGLLDLADDGGLGVFGLDGDKDVVRRYPVQIIRTESNRAWIGGLPQMVRIITRGQGYVVPGESVVAVEG